MVRNDLLVNLFTDRSKESILARKYLENAGIDFEERDSRTFGSMDTTPNNRMFGAHFGIPRYPFIVSEDILGECSYYSFLGVKSYIRKKMSEDLFGDQQSLEPRRFWKNIKTSFQKNKEITYFDEKGNNLFEGPMDKIHVDLKSILNEHPHEDWHYVSCWTVGRLGGLSQKQTERGFILDEDTRTILFPDDIDTLKKGKNIVTVDNKSGNNLTYEAYFTDVTGWEVEEEVFGIYAHFQD